MKFLKLKTKQNLVQTQQQNRDNRGNSETDYTRIGIIELGGKKKTSKLEENEQISILH